MPRRAHDRNLAKRHAERAAERARRKRRRTLIRGVSAGLVAVLGVALILVFTGNKPSTTSASPTPAATTSPTPTPTATPTGVACGGTVPAAASVKKPTFKAAPPMTIDTAKTYLATFVTSCGTFVVQLDAKTAPHTVNSLVFLIEKRFFDGLTFHRIWKGFVIQGGDPLGNGTGGPGYTTVDAPPANAKYPIGTVAMAKSYSQPAGAAGSQFFVVTTETAQQAKTIQQVLAPGGKGQYTIVGHVVKGLAVIQRIDALPVLPSQLGANDGPPAHKVYIVKVTVTVA